MIQVVGGSGALGSTVATQAMFAGQPARFMTRSPARSAGLREAGADVVQGDRRRVVLFVAAEDVARFALLAVHDLALAGETIDIGGPDNLTSMDVVRLYEGLTGQQARTTHIPLTVPRVAYPLTRLEDWDRHRNPSLRRPS